MEHVWGAKAYIQPNIPSSWNNNNVRILESEFEFEQIQF